MKNKFLTILAATSLLVGCSDAYDIEQKGFRTEESQIFNTSADIEKGIQGLYYSFPGETEVFFDSFFTDELGVGKNNGGHGVNDGSYTFLLTAGNSDVEDIWSSYMGVINRVNRLINRIDELMPSASAAEATAFKSQKAALLGLRAYSHYKLFAYFTPDYTNPSGPSIIKFDFLQTDDYSRNEKRATVAEIVAFIEKDVEDARTLGITNTDTSYMNENVLDAILVKLYSMQASSASYAKLETAFNRLTTSNSPRALADLGDFAGLFTGYPSPVSNESIFRLKRTQNYGSTTTVGIASRWYASRVDASEIVYMEMGRSLYNELDKLDPSLTGQPVFGNTRKDMRFNLYVLPSSTPVANYASLSLDQYMSRDILLIGKYTGITNRPLANDVQQLRFTDMLLALAEKRAFEGALDGNVAVGDYSNVKSIIYNIRVSRNTEGESGVSMPTDFGSQKAAYARILEERRVEFAFEGMRYLDMKRLGVKAGSAGFVRDPQDCASTNACQLEPTSFKMTLPIPRSEMLANPNMVQNPGY